MCCPNLHINPSAPKKAKMTVCLPPTFENINRKSEEEENNNKKKINGFHSSLVCIFNLPSAKNGGKEPLSKCVWRQLFGLVVES